MNCFLLIAAAIGAVAAPEQFHVENAIVYERPGGEPVRLNLYLPKEDGGEMRPAVLLIHGGAWLFGTRHQLDYYGRRLAQSGYVAASISYRMMPKYGFPACLYDAKAAVRWLRQHAAEFKINPDKIGCIGNSAGGHLVSLLGTTRPKDNLEGDQNPGFSTSVQAVVSLYGVSDLSYYRDPRGYIRLGGFTKLFMKNFLTKEEVTSEDPYERASPVYYAHPDCPPFLLVHGLRDGQVPYAQAVSFYETLRRLGIPARMITVPYGHAYDYFHMRTRDDVFAEVLAFFEQNLK